MKRQKRANPYFSSEYIRNIVSWVWIMFKECFEKILSLGVDKTNAA